MFELAIVKSYHNYTHVFYLKVFGYEIISVTYGKDIGIQIFNKKIV
jgi:trans-2-enoyl-CoA reductase